MQRLYFFDSFKIEKRMTSKKVDANGQTVSWLKTREIKLVKSKPEVLWMQFDFSGTFQEVFIGKRSKRN